MIHRLIPLPAVVLSWLAAAGCSSQPKPVEIDAAKLKVFQVLPAAVETPANPITDEKVSLGRMLYYDTRLSKGQDKSCNSCHKLDAYGVDNEPTSEGHKKQRGNRNSPTVYNAAGHAVQFWDGRAKDVEEQAKGPVLNPVEMAMPGEKHVLAVIESIPEYVQAFQKAFPGEKKPVTYDNMAKAIGAFERKLTTPDRFDKFLAGDAAALSNEEKAGLNKYLDAGCAACHFGPYLGGSMFQKLGLVKPWPNQKDQGRYEATKQDVDRMMFKVPSLRNIEKTWPYFHDGSVASLEEAVKLMGAHQVERPLTDSEAAQIVTFLKTLTGVIPADYIKPPELPKSTARTPKPDLS